MSEVIAFSFNIFRCYAVVKWEVLISPASLETKESSIQVQGCSVTVKPRSEKGLRDREREREGRGKTWQLYVTFTDNDSCGASGYELSGSGHGGEARRSAPADMSRGDTGDLINHTAAAVSFFCSKRPQNEALS